MDNRPILAITLGDPSGIGPETVASLCTQDALYALCRPVVTGPASVLARAAAQFAPGLVVKTMTDIAQCAFEKGAIEMFDTGGVDAGDLSIGQVDARSGDAAFRAVVKAIELAQAGAVDGTVTAPLNKEALNLAGHHFAGHTEIYAQYTNTKNYTMMLAHGNLRVVHVSTHVSLRRACDAVTQARVREVIGHAHDACRRLGLAAPRVAVAGLNPHAGENGLFGDEELREIIPAIEEARAQGIDAIGPQPPDSVFAKAMAGAYDIVVAMYHDQGHIPVKCMGFSFGGEKAKIGGVNITLGTPIVRVSVDHGTAFDIAWKGIADSGSLMEACEYAAKLALAR